MNDKAGHDRTLQRAIQAAKLANRKYRHQANTGDGLYVPHAIPSPEHHHIIYHVPKEGVAIPNYREVFVSSREAYERLQETVLQAKNHEYYEDGRVGVETPVHGRTGLHWVILEVAACIRSTCTKLLSRAEQKRRLIPLSGEKP